MTQEEPKKVANDESVPSTASASPLTDGSDSPKLGITSFDVDSGKEKKWENIPRNQRFLFTVWHVMSGCLALLGWNMVLNSVLTFQNVLWPGEILSDTILGCNQAGAVLTVVALIFLDSATLNLRLCRASHGLILIAMCALPVPVFLLSGKENISAAKGVLAVVVLILGVGAGIYQAQAFAFAALIPRKRDQQIFISTGNGLAGVISWVTYTICYEAIFEKQVVKHQQYLITVMVVVAILCLAFTYALMETCTRFPIFVEKLAEAKSLKKEEAEKLARAVEEGKQDKLEVTEFWPTVKRCIYPAFRVGFTLFITILVFPTCGPFAWPLSSSLQNANMGVFQIGDLIFRFIPALGSWTILSVRMTEGLVFGRVLFLVPFFIMPAYLRDAAFISSAPWLFICMIVMVLSNGWGITCAFIHCMGAARNKKEAETTANVMTLAVVLGASSGAFSSKLPVLNVQR